MNEHLMHDFPGSDIVIEQVIEALQRVLRGERTPEQRRLILKNASMLLADLSVENGHELG